MSKAYSLTAEFLKKENIEYFGAVDFSLCRVINQRKIIGFEPKSAIIFLIPYKTGDYPQRNLSLYSVSRDYHLYAKQLEARLCGFIENNLGKNYIFRLFCDNSPIDERAAAIDACLGVRGENGLIINEKYGSFVFVAAILTDAVFDKGEYVSNFGKEKSCIKCGKCKEKCDFLSGKSDICFSSVTQKKAVTEQELEQIKSRQIRWGCDDCQVICPMNSGVQSTPIEFFYQEPIPFLTADSLNKMSDDEFKKRAYSWRGKEAIMRNL